MNLRPPGPQNGPRRGEAARRANRVRNSPFTAASDWAVMRGSGPQVGDKRHRGGARSTRPVLPAGAPARHPEQVIDLPRRRPWRRAADARTRVAGPETRTAANLSRGQRVRSAPGTPRCAKRTSDRPVGGVITQSGATCRRAAPGCRALPPETPCQRAPRTDRRPAALLSPPFWSPLGVQPTSERPYLRAFRLYRCRDSNAILALEQSGVRARVCRTPVAQLDRHIADFTVRRWNPADQVFPPNRAFSGPPVPLVTHAIPSRQGGGRSFAAGIARRTAHAGLQRIHLDPRSIGQESLRPPCASQPGRHPVNPPRACARSDARAPGGSPARSAACPRAP